MPNCKYCNVEFTKSFRHRVFCSETCRAKHNSYKKLKKESDQNQGYKSLTPEEQQQECLKYAKYLMEKNNG